MIFKNPKIPEGINVTDEHPLKEFTQLVVGGVLCVVALVLLLNYSVQYLVRYIPFEYEVQMTQDLAFFEQKNQAPYVLKRQQYLQQLADELSGKMGLHDGVKIIAHYIDQPITNAFATLGGNVVIYQGLLDQLSNEEALGMVMAHEIAHIKQRHPINALSKGITMMVVAAMITGASGSSAGEVLIGSSTSLSLLKFSRDQEQHADMIAAQALQDYYGNIAGAQELFDLFQTLSSESLRSPELFLSHPHSDQRWRSLQDQAKKMGWSLVGELTAIPEFLVNSQENASQ